MDVAGKPLRLVCFELRGQELALPIDDVRETVPMQPITRVFLTPPCLAGVFSLRGEIVPAIDLGVLLGLSRTEVGDDSRIVVIAHAAGTAGIVVDRMRELRTLAPPLEPPPPDLQHLLGAMPGNTKAMDGFAQVNAGTLSPAAFFAPSNIDAIVNASRQA